MMTEEDEAFFQIEKKQNYNEGWNAAIEAIMFDMTHKFTLPFGKDTVASLAAYIREFKK